MMRTLAVFLVAGVLVSTGCSRSTAASAGAQASPEPAAASTADDQQNLLGTWKMERASLNGQPLMNDVRWIFDRDHLTIVLRGNYQDGVKAPFQLGTGDNPNTILIKYFDNPLAAQGYEGGSYTGIYKLSGDKLKVCYDMRGRRYPNSIDCGKGSGYMFQEFTREKTGGA
jgi:uncharacterized protein (TIGR03067 family)